MFCYQGVPYVRIYLPRKDKRLAWKAYFSKEYYSDYWELSDLKKAYHKLYKDWDEEKYWEEAEVFLDDMY